MGARRRRPQTLRQATGVEPFDPRTVAPAPAPAAMLALKRHMVKATVCGHARRGEGMVALWAHVNCEECLKARSGPKDTGP
jgi:hypothetical protein